MFVARGHELKSLENLYRRKGFQMAVIYGRRRIGKTSLIDEFVKGKRALYYTAQVRSSLLNLRELSRLIREFFNLPATMPPFDAWSDALSFIADQAGSERIVFVFDELPYAAHSEPGLPSALQVAIDHGFKSSGPSASTCEPSSDWALSSAASHSGRTRPDRKRGSIPSPTRSSRSGTDSWNLRSEPWSWERAKPSPLFCECKWRNDFNETETLSALERRSQLVGKFRSRTFALITKNPVSAATQEKAAARDDLMLVSVDDMFS